MKIAFMGHSAIHPRQFTFYEEFAKLGNEILVLSPHEWGNQRLVAYDLENYRCLTFNCSNAGDLFSYEFPDLAFQELEKFKPDIIHIQNELRCAQTKKTRLWAFELNCKFTIFVFENIYSPQKSDDVVIKNADLIITGNKDAQKLLADFVPSKTQTVVLPQTGINLEMFKPMDTGKQFHLGYAGRLVPEKGIEMIRKIGEELKITINWISGKKYAEVAQELNRCLIFIYPPFQISIWKEQCGYSPLEAMACGIPVVATKCGSLPEYLGDAALLADEHDLNRLKYFVELLLTDEELRKIKGNEGLERIKTIFSNQGVAKAYLDLFNQLLRK